MHNDLMLRLIDGALETIEMHAEELTRLDQAIGDGDHGINMTRGFREVAAKREEIAGLPFAEGLQELGTILATKVGGASGPLYGTLLIEMGKAAPATGMPTHAELAAMIDTGVAAIKAQGEAEPGMKTMLDVLCPVADTFRKLVDIGELHEIDARMMAVIGHSLHRTSMLEAKRGRAAALGADSVGHIDPGACSSALLIGSMLGILFPQN